MDMYPTPVERLISQFERLPGIGRKSAQRLAFFVLSLPEEEAEAFAEAVVEAKRGIMYCKVCQNLSGAEVCAVCAGAARDRGLICVVEGPRDVAAIEKTREFHGLYHVLHGVISPMNRVGPDDIRIKELLARVHEGGVTEVIMATNPDTEGEATAMYISRLIRPFGVRVTRLALGVPVGGHLEFSDEITLTHALEGRREI